MQHICMHARDATPPPPPHHKKLGGPEMAPPPPGSEPCTVALAYVDFLLNSTLRWGWFMLQNPTEPQRKVEYSKQGAHAGLKSP